MMCVVEFLLWGAESGMGREEERGGERSSGCGDGFLGGDLRVL